DGAHALTPHRLGIRQLHIDFTQHISNGKGESTIEGCQKPPTASDEELGAYGGEIEAVALDRGGRHLRLPLDCRSPQDPFQKIHLEKAELVAGILVCNFDLYRLVRVVHTGPSSYRYADRPVAGGSVKNRPSAVDFGR
ncbi:hypothetical protein BHM03_00062287, partial [Ensete ventricosum]